MERETVYRLKAKHSALGAGSAGLHNNELIEAPEDEDEFDVMNDETFGDNIDEDFDWEEEHEKFAEIIDPVPAHGNKTKDSGYDPNERSYRSQEEYMEHSISQLVVEDDDEIDDPAILNVSKSRPIPKKPQNLDDIFGPSSPPGYLDTEHLVSPSSKNIWGSPVKESSMSPAPSSGGINNLQSLFEFAKAATHRQPSKEPAVISTPERPHPGGQEIYGKTLEEIEQILHTPKSVKTPMTAEELEREMIGDQRVPQMPVQALRSPYQLPPHLPPTHIPPPGTPGMIGSPMGPRMHQTPPLQRVIPGFSPVQNLDGRRSPLMMAVAGSTPPGLGRVSPQTLIHRQSPLAAGLPVGLSPISRTTPSPPPVPILPPHLPQVTHARMMSPYARGGMSNDMMGSSRRGQTQPIGIPRQPLPRRPVNHASSPYSSPGGPYQSPSNGLHNSPGGYNSPNTRGHYSSPQSEQRSFRGRGGRGYHNNNNRNNGYREGYREGYRDREGSYRDNREGYREGYRDRESYREGHRESNGDRNYNNSEHRPSNRRYYQYNSERDRESIGKPGDEYAGLMIQKEKDWIIKIQLMQLQTDNPYLDDFYYTTITMKKKALERQKMVENGIDGKDYDPELIIPALGKLETKAYKPAQFEGSLGRLTTSSVHNPRQIIDVRSNSSPGPDESDQKNVSKELRRSRQLLTEIEKGYNLLLEVDDIEKRILALPEEARIPMYDDRKDLLLHLHKYILHEESSEHFLSIMSIRKGRKLVARVLPLLDKLQSASVVQFLFRNLQALIKKDEKEEGLMLLHDPVIHVIEACDLDSLVKFSKELQVESTPHQSKSVAIAIQNKFGSSVIGSLLHRGEILYIKTSPLDMDNQLQSIWCQFVHDVAGILAVVPTESLVHPKVHHTSIVDHLDRLLNKKLIAIIEDKVKLFTEPQTV